MHRGAKTPQSTASVGAPPVTASGNTNTSEPDYLQQYGTPSGQPSLTPSNQQNVGDFETCTANGNCVTAGVFRNAGGLASEINTPKIYPVQQGDTWQLISTKIYGTPNLAGLLMTANGYNPTYSNMGDAYALNLEYQGNIQLNVPSTASLDNSQLSTLLDAGQRLNANDKASGTFSDERIFADSLALSNQTTPISDGQLKLYGAVGVPTRLAVEQGQLGDCWIESGIVQVALHDPHQIENEIHDNGDGTYTVTLPGYGKPVTVTGDQFSYGGGHWTGNNLNGNGNYANVLENAAMVAYGESGSNLPSTATTPEFQRQGFFIMNDGGYGYESTSLLNSLTKNVDYADTGTSSYAMLSPTASSMNITPMAGEFSYTGNVKYSINNLAADFNNGAEIVASTSPGSPMALNSEMVSGHAYSVIGVKYNNDGSVAGVTLYNPWGQGAPSGIMDTSIPASQTNRLPEYVYVPASGLHSNLTFMSVSFPKY